MPRTIIAFDEDDDSDSYVDFFPFDAIPGPSREREPPIPDPVIEIPDDTDVEPTEPADPILRQELERSRAEIADIDKKIDELYKNIAELKQLKSIREHDMRSAQSQMKMRGRTRSRINHQIDYETRMDFEWSEEMMSRMKRVFKIDRFRHCQQGVCNAVMDKRDVVCVMPTGGGKSLTYQLTALLQTGCTLVISPLIALIADQVFHLREAGIEAVRFTGATPEGERGRIYGILRAMADGTHSESQKEIKLCYVTPEMILRNTQFQELLSRMAETGKLARIVIDEAHCVSELGHDFRKDYGELGFLRSSYPNVPILALSATCPPRVLSNVLQLLGMKSIIEHNDPRRTLYFSSPLYRKNLHYSILPKPEGQKEAIKEMAKYILENHPHDSGIIYCLRKKDSETVAKELRTASMGQIRSDFYHADISDSHKEHLHMEWLRGNVKVVCATIAFGLGIDKADVRFVLHFSVPKSIECYYQESGRAGRDGKDSDCILYYRPQDCMSLFALVIGRKDNQDKVLAMIRFCENVVRCRKLLFAQYFSVASQLHKSSWTTEEVDASDPCGHCDNCKRPIGSVENRDVTEDAWKLVKVLASVNRPLTLKMLTSLARGNGGGTYELLGGGKGKINLKEVIGSPTKLKPIDSEHLFNHLMTERYFEVVTMESHGRSPQDRTVNVYVKPGAANGLEHASRNNIPRGVVRHTFLNRPKVAHSPKAKKKKENGKAKESRGRKRKRGVVELELCEGGDVLNEQERSDNETEEVEREILDLTGYESGLENGVDEEEDEIAYGWSHSMCEPPPVKRRRYSRKSPQYDVPDSECEREREEEAIDISSD